MSKMLRLSLLTLNKAQYSQRVTPFDLLPHSQLPMDHFQDSLPRLKVPKLEETLNKYLLSQKAFLCDNPTAYKETERIAKEFQENKTVLDLQNELTQFAKSNKHTSYITEMWFDMYLRDRRAVVLNHQPVLIFQDATGSLDANKVEIRATNMLFSAARFIRTFQRGILEPDVYHLIAKNNNEKYRKVMSYFPKSVSWFGSYLLYKAFPLDMSQFPNLLFSTRIPQVEKDKLVTSPNSKHVVVICKGNFYTFDILEKNGNIISPSQMLSNIRFILQQPASKESAGIGNVTSLPRDDWTKLREKLVKNATNAKSIASIDSGAFVLCLDDEVLNTPNEELLHTLHGPGDNRWFDKSFSLILNSNNGRAALTFEHSWGDGVAVVRFCNDIYQDTNTRPVVGMASDVNSSSSLPTSNVEQLKWDFTYDDLQNELLHAKQAYDKRRRELDFHYTQNEQFGRKQAKLTSIGPDCIMQTALQMSFYRLHGHFPATYESCSTAAFKHGRTETIRSATLATNEFTRAALSATPPSNEELHSLLTKCSERHSQLTKDAAMGQGWDRHLFALRNFATKNNSLTTIPPLFNDKSYQEINHIRLSTSTLSAPSLLLGGFAAVVPNGYGVGYAMMDDKCGCCVTTWENQGTKGEEFCDAFNESVKVIAKIAQTKKK